MGEDQRGHKSRSNKLHIVDRRTTNFNDQKVMEDEAEEVSRNQKRMTLYD